MYGGVHSEGRTGNLGDNASLAPVEVVGIAASTGGLQALGRLLGTLPEEFPCPVVVVQHLCPAYHYKSVLDRVLATKTRLRVQWAEQGQRLQAGCVLLAPQDRHVEITEDRTVRLTDSSRVNYVRPAADVLFTSMAKHFGGTAAAVILSGALYDGAAGAYEIAAAGGRVLAQDRETSVAPDMPVSAIRTGAVDFVFSPEMIARALITLSMAPGAAAWFRVWPKKLTRPARMPAWDHFLWDDLDSPF